MVEMTIDQALQRHEDNNTVISKAVDRLINEVEELKERLGKYERLTNLINNPDEMKALVKEAIDSVVKKPKINVEVSP